MKITIGGLIGSGKSTIAREIANTFNIRHISAGKIMRDMALEREMTLMEFSRYAEANSEIDKEIDQRQRDAAMGDCVIDGRLSAHFFNPDLSIWLTAPLDERARRVANRENITIDEAREQIMEREKSEKERYMNFYNIDIYDISIYDLIINTARFDIKGMKNIIFPAIENIMNQSGR